MSNLTSDAMAEGEDLLQGFVEQVDILAPAGLTCVVTRYPEYYRIAEHLARFTDAPIGMAMGADTLRAVLDGARSFADRVPALIGTALEGGQLATRDQELSLELDLKAVVYD